MKGPRHYIRCIGTMVLPVLVFLCSAGMADVITGAVPIENGDTPDTVVAKAVQVRPHPRQLAWQQRELIAFIHFTVNTFTDKEWGEGTEDPAIFNPTELDARQWVRVCKEAGMKMVILTAKHHDGFCLWPSKYTEHSVKNSPWKGGKGDVVAELAQACREAGLALGLYLSPWDRHEKSYGDSPKYNEYYVKQLTELLTNYGPVAEVWMDGACGEGPNGKRQVYDWPTYFATVRRLQPDAVIFNGPDVRWVGNEAGYARETEWSVVGVDTLDGLGYSLEASGRITGKDLGSLDLLRKSKFMVWYPAETDVSIRPGWFYHAAEDARVKTVQQLLDIYYASVGRNSLLLLNLPPDRRGLIHETDARRLSEFGRVLRATFTKNLAAGAKAVAVPAGTSAGTDDPKKIVDADPATHWVSPTAESPVTIELDLGTATTFNRLMLQEYIVLGQRIEEFTFEVRTPDGWKQVARGTTVGYKRLLVFDNVTTDKVRLHIVRSRLNPTLCNLGLFYQPPLADILKP